MTDPHIRLQTRWAFTATRRLAEHHLAESETVSLQPFGLVAE
jgi:hypothetical protein